MKTEAAPMKLTARKAMESDLSLEFLRVVEQAAIASALTMGQGDRHRSDQAAVTAMRKELDTVPIDGTIVIGEGERDEAPMLYIGEKVGSGGPKVDIALDPLEGTTICATGAPNALAVIAMADGGNLLHCPDTYMAKIAAGPDGRGVVDLDKTPTQNLQALAEAKRCNVEDLMVIILSRPRHEAIIQEIRKAGARIRLIGDGDVSAAIATTKPETGIDLLLGIGGAPEGVLAAAALRCVGGEFQGRLAPRNDEEIERAKKMGVTDIKKKFMIDELAAGDVMFAATGVTDGDYLHGVHFFPGGATTQSVVMRSKTKTIRVINASHYFEHKPNY